MAACRHDLYLHRRATVTASSNFAFNSRKETFCVHVTPQVSFTAAIEIIDGKAEMLTGVEMLFFLWIASSTPLGGSSLLFHSAVVYVPQCCVTSTSVISMLRVYFAGGGSLSICVLLVY